MIGTVLFLLFGKISEASYASIVKSHNTYALATERHFIESRAKADSGGDFFCFFRFFRHPGVAEFSYIMSELGNTTFKPLTAINYSIKIFPNHSID